MPSLAFLAIVWLLPRQVQGQTQDQVEALYNTLLKGQNKNIRPAVNHSDPTEVNVSFELFQILDVDEAMGKLTISGRLTLEWYDHRMRWNPIDHGGVDTINVPSSATWKPDLVSTEPIENAIVFGHMQNWVTVRYLYDGKAVFAPAGVISSACNLTVFYYPYDTQRCEINLYPMGMNTHEIELNTNTTELSNTSIIAEDAEWKWIWDRNETSTGIMFDNFYFYRIVLNMERRSDFVYTNVVRPIYFMIILNTITFLIPASSGERVSCSLTLLLAVSFYMAIVYDTLPNSNPTPAICRILLSSLNLSYVIAMMSIINHAISLWVDKYMIQRSNVRHNNRLPAEATASLNGEQNERLERMGGFYTKAIVASDIICMVISSAWMFLHNICRIYVENANVR